MRAYSGQQAQHLNWYERCPVRGQLGSAPPSICYHIVGFPLVEKQCVLYCSKKGTEPLELVPSTVWDVPLCYPVRSLYSSIMQVLCLFLSFGRGEI